jgi:hypothetical protein
MIITTDASDNGYGAVLEQHIRTKDGSFNKRPIEYFSKSYTPAQNNYSTTKKELFNNRKRIINSCYECRTFSFICLWKTIYNLHRSPTKNAIMEQITTTPTCRKMDDENGVIPI